MFRIHTINVTAIDDNGPLNGKNQWKYPDGMIYDGEWRHGVPHGKGVITWPSGESYAGCHRKGMITGWGTYTDVVGKQYRGLWFNDRLLFNKKAPIPGSGHIFNGRRKCKRVYCDRDNPFQSLTWIGCGIADRGGGDVYDGEWENNMPHGYGILIQSNGLRYQGEWQYGKMHGHGSYTSPKHDFEGEFVNGKREGLGITHFRSGNVYEGPYKNDKRHGNGVLTFADGTRMICTYDQGNVVGEGEKYYSDGGTYNGALSHNGLPHGIGVWELPDGSRYEGEHNMGYRHGKGVMIFPDGTRQEGWFDEDFYIGTENKETASASESDTEQNADQA